MSGGEMMNTSRVARYLGIHEKQVYALIRAGKIPATKITGKWVFPRKLVDDWIESHARSGIESARAKSRAISGALLACGSNDPILDMLQTHVKHEFPEFLILSANTGSTEGLRALNRGYTDIAWSHLLDPESGQYNTPFLATHLPDVKAVVVNLFHRELGLVMAPRNPFGIRGIEDLNQQGVRLVNRQKGSGTRLLLDDHLNRLKIPSGSLPGYEQEVYTHFEVGLSILAGEADAGLATVAVAEFLGLPFIPLALENFDMILDQRIYFHKGVQAFIETLNSKSFRKRVERIEGYDFTDSGKIFCSLN